MSSPQATLLIDASIYIFQYYFSLPDNWYSEKEGWPTAAVYGYTTFLLRLLHEQPRPLRIAACFDESLDSCFRNTIYPEYKCSRALPDEALAFQLNACKKITQLLGIATFASRTHEADDLIGSLYRKAKRSRQPIAILTRDKDLGQLLQREQDHLWDYAKDQRFYANDIYQKFGVMPEQMADFLALVGDVSDDIPGVPGIGPKTAAQLLNQFGTLRNLVDNRAALLTQSIRGASRIFSNIEEYREQIAMSYQLATIVTDLPLIASNNELVCDSPKLVALKRFCKAMGFPRLYTRIESLQ